LRVSWLIPFHNGKPWLSKAVKSALAQCTNNDEVVLIDDGSDDGSADDLPVDSRIRLIRQDWQGIVAALERGRALCRGRFIARLDADDTAISGRIEAQVTALERDANLGAVGGKAILVNELNETNKGMSLYVEWVNKQLDPLPQRLVESPLFHPAVTIRASAIDSVGGYRAGDFPEDYDLWLRLVGAGWGIKNLDRYVVEIRDHSGRLTRNDTRYSKAGFTQVKLNHMSNFIAPTPKRVAIMGAGKGARPWIRWARSQGHDLTLIMDVKPGGSRGGTPVLGVEELANSDIDLLLVTVGSRGVRDQLRSQILTLRPDLIEGTQWFAVA